MARRATPGPAAGTLVVRGVRVVDGGRGAADGRPADILIEEGRVVRVAPAGALAAEGVPAVDGAGRFAVPGLIDCHAHVTGIFLPAVPQRPSPGILRWAFGQIALNLRAHLSAGVTTVRDMAAPLRVVTRLRSRSLSPESGFPRILCAGPMLTVPGGYPGFVPPDRALLRAALGPLRVELGGTRDAARWVDRLCDAGVDWIKVAFASRDYDDARTPLQTPSMELMRAVAARAARRGLPVAVHHGWVGDLDRLLEMPFDTLEHLTQDGDIPDAALDRMASRGLPVTSDLEVYAFLDKIDEHLGAAQRGAGPLLPQPRRALVATLRELAAGRSPNPHFGLNALRGTAERKRRNLRRLAERGIAVGAATDGGTNLLFGRMPDELLHMVDAGLEPAAALRAATVDAARLLGRADLGRIAPGYRADILLVDGDPLADLGRLRRPALVMRDGVVVAGASHGLAP